VGEHFLAALLSESVKALAAQLQQLVALGVAQFLASHQVVGASLVAGDAVEGEPCPPCAAVSAGNVLRGGRAAAAEELHEHQGLVDVAHAHALGDGAAQALVGGEGVGDMGTQVLDRFCQSLGSRPQCRTASTTMVSCSGMGR